MPRRQTGSAMKRGEIRYVDLDPVRGSEANKRRPAVVVSNEHANQAAVGLGRGVITVVPLTSNTTRVLSFQVLLHARETGLPRDSKAQPEQIRAVSVHRIGEVAGWVPPKLMREIDAAIRVHLQL